MEALTEAKEFVVNDRRGQAKPSAPERHGKAANFIPSRDRVLVKRLAAITEDGLIARPEVTVELAERGEVIAVGVCEYGAPPVGVIASFSKYGAEEKRFDDDAGPNTYALVWIDDVRGWDARD
jgi:co-chaperonin GroES (HSP10)